MASLGYMRRSCLKKQMTNKRARRGSPYGRVRLADGEKGEGRNVEKAVRLQAHGHPGSKIRAEERGTQLR